MKKIMVVIVAFVITSAAYTQDGNLKKQFYLRFGASLPTWKFYGYDGKSDFTDNTKRIGGIFEVGSIYMLNGIKLADGMRIGINVDYLSLGMNKFKMDGSNASNAFYFAGSKIGPSFSYSPVNHLVIDTYVKFNPVWVAMDNISFSDDNIENQFFLGFMGIKYSVGLNVRFSVLMLGFEFNPGYSKLRYFDKEENKLSEDYYGDASKVNSKKTPVPCMNMTLGLSF
jgi:hypothetical protein